MSDKEEIYEKISEFKRRLSDIFTLESLKNENIEIFYKQDFISPKYKVTIEMVDDKSFVASQGRKWIRAD